MFTGNAASVAVDIMAALANRHHQRLVMLIDGGSGAGKTNLAKLFCEVWPGQAQLVHLDDCYPGWSGLAAGSAQVPGMLTQRRPGYWRWDWESSEPSGWVDIDPHTDLIVEGCGALTKESKALATSSVWCQLDTPERKRRALAREPEFTSYWGLWAQQEHAHWLTNQPRRLAEILVRIS